MSRRLKSRLKVLKYRRWWVSSILRRCRIEIILDARVPFPRLIRKYKKNTCCNRRCNRCANFLKKNCLNLVHHCRGSVCYIRFFHHSKGPCASGSGMLDCSINLCSHQISPDHQFLAGVDQISIFYILVAGID